MTKFVGKLNRLMLKQKEEMIVHIVNKGNYQKLRKNQTKQQQLN